MQKSCPNNLIGVIYETPLPYLYYLSVDGATATWLGWCPPAPRCRRPPAPPSAPPRGRRHTDSRPTPGRQHNYTEETRERDWTDSSSLKTNNWNNINNIFGYIFATCFSALGCGVPSLINIVSVSGGRWLKNNKLEQWDAKQTRVFSAESFDGVAFCSHSFVINYTLIN